MEQEMERMGESEKKKKRDGSCRKSRGKVERCRMDARDGVDERKNKAGKLSVGKQ